ARDASGCVVGGEALVEVVGVALHGDLGAGSQRDLGEHTDQRGSWDERGGPASDEHAGDRLAPGDLTADVGSTGGEVPLDQVPPVRPRGEGAVVAAMPAERHVEVEPERHGATLLAATRWPGVRLLPPRPHSASDPRRTLRG